MNLRKTKIIATFGPALKNEVKLTKLINLGVDVIRFNFSHLNPASATENLNFIEGIAAKLGKSMTFLADLKGPEIRLNLESHTLKTNQTIAFVYAKAPISNSIKCNSKYYLIGMDHPKLYKLVKKGMIIKGDDSNFKFKVDKIVGEKIICKTLISGELKAKKSLHISKLDLQLPILSQQDKENLKVIVKRKFSWIAASFVGKASDVTTIRKAVNKLGGDIPIISKIESYHGVNNLEEILEQSEGIMVARGDLGQEYPYEKIPELQDQIVEATQAHGKVCIIATQMLNSMIESPIPTRSEVTDVTVAVKDRVDAVMLSGETAAGKFPIKAIEVMDRVIKNTEKRIDQNPNLQLVDYKNNQHHLVPLCKSALNYTNASQARCLLILTSKGRGPVYTSACRPRDLTFVATRNKNLYLRNRLYYSIKSIHIKTSKEALLEKAIAWLKSNKILKKNEKIVYVYSDYDKHNIRTDHICQRMVI